MQSVGGPERNLIVLLTGGPYDGQDIVVSKEEWAEGCLTRNGYRYTSEAITLGVGPSPSCVRIFTWVGLAL